MLVGAHESVAGGLDKAFEHAARRSDEAVQIFTKSSAMWKEPSLGADAASAFRAARAAWGGRPVIAHGTYLVNLCSDRGDILERSRQAVVAELERCDKLGIAAVSFHPGARMDMAPAAALELLGESLALVLEQSRGASTRLCIENTAGQGSVMGWSLDEIAAMIEKAGPAGDRLGVCLDTQHLFAAGYDLRTAAGYDAFFRELDAKIGVGRIAAFHLNDSKKPLGQRVDRHEEIGAGEIGLYPFYRLMNDPRFAAVPAVVELEDQLATQSLGRLWAMRGAPEPVEKKIVAPLLLTPPPPPKKRARR